MSLTIKKAKELGIEFILGDEILFTTQQMEDSETYTLKMSCQIQNINDPNQCEIMFNQTVKAFAWRSTPLPELFNYTIERKGHKWRPTLEQGCCDCGLSPLVHSWLLTSIDYTGEKEVPKDVYEAGTIEHCYEVLEGDLNNVCNGELQESSKYVLYHSGKFYLSDVFYGRTGWDKICTIDEFNAYKDKQETQATQGKTIWTTEMAEAGVPLEVGMICMWYDLKVKVSYIGNDIAVMFSEEAQEEHVSYIDNLEPIETRSPLELQQDQVLEFMHQNSQMTTVEIVQALQDNGFLKDV